MVTIKPFRGYVYNEKKTGDRSNVIAPPWDVIGETLQTALLARSPYNIIRLIAKTAAPDQVKQVFDGWRDNHVLAKDSAPCLYHLTHTFSHGGKQMERTGVFALLELEDLKSGKVIPHEYVFDKQMDNRYRLIDACRANFSPVFMLYRDEKNSIEAAAGKIEPDFSARLDGDTLSVRRITRPDDVSACIATLSAGPLFIADGHHRYQAAFNVYRDNPAPENKNVLVYCANLESPSLLILPTHRCVPDIALKDKRKELAEFFEITEAAGTEQMFALMKPDNRIRKKIGAWSAGKFYVLSLKDEKALLPRLPRDHADAWKLLDTIILHQFILKEVFKTDEDARFFYAQEPETVMKKCREENGSAFFLNPVTAQEFRETVLHGEVMPQKSTYFYPKVPTGIVIHRFGDI